MQLDQVPKKVVPAEVLTGLKVVRLKQPNQVKVKLTPDAVFSAGNEVRLEQPCHA